LAKRRLPPKLHIEEAPGDHFSALPVAVKRYFDIVEKNRKE
jgi:hypothetical protein